MNFGDALEKVKNGDPVRRKGWKGNLSLRKDGSGRTTSNFTLGDEKESYPWASPWEDLLADDWEEVDLEREKKEKEEEQNKERERLTGQRQAQEQNKPVTPGDDSRAANQEKNANTGRAGSFQNASGRADSTDPPLGEGNPTPPFGETLPETPEGPAPNPNYYPNPSTPGYNIKRRNNNTIEDLDVKTEPVYNPDPRPDNRPGAGEKLYNPRPDTALPLIPDHKITAPAFRSGPGNQPPDNPIAVPLNPTNPSSTDKPANPTVRQPPRFPAENPTNPTDASHIPVAPSHIPVARPDGSPGRTLPETDRPETGPRPRLPHEAPDPNDSGLHPDLERPTTENARPDHSVPNQLPGNPGAKPTNPIADMPGSERPTVDKNLPNSPKEEPKVDNSLPKPEPPKPPAPKPTTPLFKKKE